MSLRWSEDQYRAYVTKGQPAPLSEAAFQAAVVRIARQAGYMTFHVHNSKRSPEGWPDLAMIRPAGGTLYLVECKTDTGIVSEAQQAWLHALARTNGVAAEIWRPRDLEDIVGRLRGGA